MVLTIEPGIYFIDPVSEVVLTRPFSPFPLSDFPYVKLRCICFLLWFILLYLFLAFWPYEYFSVLVKVIIARMHESV